MSSQKRLLKPVKINYHNRACEGVAIVGSLRSSIVPLVSTTTIKRLFATRRTAKELLQGEPSAPFCLRLNNGDSVLDLFEVVLIASRK